MDGFDTWERMEGGTPTKTPFGRTAIFICNREGGRSSSFPLVLSLLGNVAATQQRYLRQEPPSDRRPGRLQEPLQRRP